VIKLIKTAEFVIPKEVGHCYMLQDNLIISSSILTKSNDYRNSIEFYKLYTDLCIWKHERKSAGPSSCRFILIENQVIYVLNEYLVHANLLNGDVIREWNLKETIWGPLLVYENSVICSTSSGNIYRYNLSSNECIVISKLYSNFYEAIVCNDLLFALTQSKPGFWRKSKAAIDIIRLRNLEKRLFMDLGSSSGFTNLYVGNNSVYFTKGGNISNLNYSGNINWSYSVSPSVFQTTDFHGRYGDNILCSVGSTLCLLNESTGKEIWNHKLNIRSKTIASAILHENGWILFSTCGGGFMMLEDPENFIGLYNPKTRDIHLVQTVNETPRINLHSFGHRILANAVVRQFGTQVQYVTQFIEFQIPEEPKG
jgi:hypothetical protein